MQRPEILTEHTRQIWSMVKSLALLESRVESLEHYSNQQSILVDTLTNIMEWKKKKEH